MKRTTGANLESGNDDHCGLPKELLDAIDQLPLLSMVHSVDTATNGEIESQDPIDQLAYQAKKVFWKLRVLAELGNEKAMRTLRDLGVHTADLLANISQGNGPDKDSRTTKTARYRLPDVVTLRGNFSTINDLLAAKIDDFTKGFQPRDEPPPAYPAIGAPRSFVIDVIESLYWRNDRARQIRTTLAEAEKAAGRQDYDLFYPPVMLRILANPAHSEEIKSDDEKIALAAEAAIHDAIRRRIERRLAQLAPKETAKTCRKVASESLAWPVRYSAIAEERKAQEESWNDLPLGQCLPFRLNRKNGRPRKIDSDSPTGFALAYCLELHATRTSLREDPGRLASLLNRQMHKWNPLVLSESDEDYARQASPIFALMEQIVERQERWEIAAAGLPDFPDRKNVSESSKALAAWHQAALLRAEQECRGEWEGYSRWPACVRMRASEAAKHRSHREAVSFYLKRGMQHLQH